MTTSALRNRPAPGGPGHPVHRPETRTSGLRKSSRQFEEPHYLESFIEASLRTLPGVQGGAVLGGDSRCSNRRAIDVILRMGAALV